MLKTIIISIFCLFSIFAPLTEAVEQDKQSSINIEEMTFEEILNALSNIFDIKIVLMSTIDIPRHKLSLTLEQTTFEEAINEAIRKSVLQNHALVINQEKGITRIWILKDGLQYNTDRLAAYRKMKTTTTCD